MKNLTATLCLTIAVLLGSMGVSFADDLKKGRIAYDKKDYATALREWESLARRGNSEAQLELANMYMLGKGVSKNLKQALKWFHLSARQGNELAQITLGAIYKDGLGGILEDDKAALKWFTMSAKQGSSVGQSLLGQLYLIGEGTEKDYRKAAEWFQLAANQKSSISQSRLGWMFLHGKGVAKSNFCAFLWLYSSDFSQKPKNLYFDKENEKLQKQHKRWQSSALLGLLTEHVNTKVKVFDIATKLSHECKKTKFTSFKQCVYRNYQGCIVGKDGVPEFQRKLDERKRKLVATNQRYYASALRKFEPLAKRGDSAAQYFLGEMYYWGKKGFPKDRKTAKKWTLLAATQGHSNAQYSLGSRYERKDDFKSALKWYTLSAEQGHKNAQNNLGYLYTTNGNNDYYHAYMWLKIAASSGNKGAIKSSGSIFKNFVTSWQRNKAKRLVQECKTQKFKGCSVGIITDPEFWQAVPYMKKGDWVTALGILKPLAQRGDARSQDALGIIYDNGKGVPRNVKEAIKWYRLAAKQGVVHAQRVLGVILDNERGDIQQNSKEATKWLRLAAHEGDADAQYLLGAKYHYAKGVSKNHKKAMHWYTLAAEQGFAAAQHDLGNMYHYGQGVLFSNDKISVKWHKRAAEQGYAPAQHYLGVMYALGQGVKQDNIYALMWLELAISQGRKVAEVGRKTTMGKMTPSQISEAQQLARECVLKKYKGC